MERKIGETFEFEGKKLKVMKDEKGSCDGCFFDNEDDCSSRNPTAGICNGYRRTDKKPVIFVEVKDEQPQEQAEQQKLNLCEILKDCPKGWEFYSSIYGKLRFDHININSICPIVLRKNKDFYPIVTKYGRHSADYENEGECTLFPSKDQRDWSKFTAPWLKEERLPKTWEDFIEIMNLKYPSAGCFVEEIPKGLIDSYPTLNQIVAVLKLKKLRDYYNNNWHCNWTNVYETNAVITRSHGELIVRADWAITTFLTFKSIEIANEFLINFRDLIKKAGDLI